MAIVCSIGVSDQKTPSMTNFSSCGMSCTDAAALSYTPTTVSTTALAFAQIGKYGKACPGLDQYAISKYGEAMECVPRVLAENSGRDAIKVLSALYSAHAKGEKGAGVSVDDGSVVDQAAAGVVDSLAVKESAFQLAVDAAITVLRVDLIIMAKAAGGPKAPPQGGHDA